MRRHRLGAWWGVVLAVVVALGWLPSRSAIGPVEAADRAAAPVSAGVGQSTQSWTTHNDLLGFTVQHPRDWTVSNSASGVITVESADGSAFVLVAPLLLKRATTASAVLREAVSAYPERFQRSRIDDVRQVQPKPDTAIASVSYRGEFGAGRALLLGWIVDRSAMVAAIAAPGDAFNDLKPTMVKILSSLTFTDGDYVTWQDPLEQAFSLKAPRGWKVDGGMFRYAPVDTRAEWSATAPDASIYIGSGDHTIPTYIDPSALALTAWAFPVGSTYSPGGGVNMIVRPYTTGLAYAQQYVRDTVGQTCDSIQFTERLDRQDLVALLEPVSQAYAVLGVTFVYSIGQVRFTCQLKGQPRVGYLIVTVERIQPGGLWFVAGLNGYLASPELVLQAETVDLRIVNSVTPNPQWVAMQQRITANQSQVTAQTSAEISASISSSYWNRQATMDDLSRKWSNAILGQTDVVDPDTGTTWKVASGHNYYWAPTGGNAGPNAVVGTTTADPPPDIDYTLLLEY